MLSPRTSDRLQLNVLSFYEKGMLSDCTIVAEGREIKAHKTILAMQSSYFLNYFASNKEVSTVTVNYKYKVIKALVRFMYFGGVASSADLTPSDGLDMLILSTELGLEAMDDTEILPLILPRLTIQNCFGLLLHEGLPRYPQLQDAVTDFVGTNFLKMLSSMEDKLISLPHHMLAPVLKTACKSVCTDADAEKVVRFALGHTQLETACDLLRDTKQWNWGGEEASLLRSPPNEEQEEGQEWVVHNVKLAMESTPARIVVGTFFDWCVRLDYGQEGKLRIVYESATPKGQEGPSRCLNRFPAAMFAWRVVYRGQDVFNEKPVFICFPENVQLHWSTTLPISAHDLSDDDSLQIMVNMAENPMLSLVLYYFSSDLKATVQSEDILNRLPHIEYRCLSSYTIVNSHGPPR